MYKRENAKQRPDKGKLEMMQKEFKARNINLKTALSSK